MAKRRKKAAGSIVSASVGRLLLRLRLLRGSSSWTPGVQACAPVGCGRVNCTKGTRAGRQGCRSGNALFRIGGGGTGGRPGLFGEGEWEFGGNKFPRAKAGQHNGNTDIAQHRHRETGSF